MNEHERARMIETVRALELEDGWRITDARLVDDDGEPVLLLALHDPDRPARPVRAWWELAAELPHADREDRGWDMGNLAGTWLHELCFASGGVDSWPTDADGVPWGELNWPVEGMRLPPHLQ